MSLLGNIVRSNKKEAGGGAGGLTAANNGTSVSGTTVQLGQAIAGAGAILLNNREIPMGGFSFQFGTNTDNRLIINPTTKTYGIGDISGVAGGTQLQILDAFSLVRLGDVNSVTNGTYLQIDDTTKRIVGRTGGPAQTMLDLDGTNMQYEIGDLSAAGNKAKLRVLDSSNRIDAVVDGAFRVVNFANTKRGLFIDNTNDLYQIGDIDAVNNGTFLQIDDANKKVEIQSGGGLYFFTDVTGNQSYLASGDVINATAALAEVDLRGNAGTIDLRTQDVTGLLLSKLFVDPALETVLIQANNGLTIQNDTVLLHTLTALGNGAAAALGTLTNAPAAGDPTKWIAIDDNGTTRHVPAW